MVILVVINRNQKFGLKYTKIVNSQQGISFNSKTTQITFVLLNVTEN